MAGDNVMPSFTEELEAQLLTEGDKLVLKCNVSGKPDPEVEWFFNGKNMKNDERATIKNRAGLCSLTLNDVKSSDAGEYSCKASNEEGSVETQTSVKVKPVLRTMEFTKNLEIELPVFVRHPQGLILNDGDPAAVECEVKGSQEVIWYHETEVIQNNEDFRYETSGEMHRLLIAEVFPDDSGTYRVEASNEHGTTSSTFTIFVNVPDEEPSGPVFLEFPLSKNVDEGTPVSFSCSLDKVDTVTWMKGTQVLDETGRFRISSSDNGSTFTIPAALATDSGVFSVEANNEKGNSLWTFTLGVNVSASPCADIDIQGLIASVQ